MKLLSMKALGGHRYQATFDVGTYEIEVRQHVNGIQTMDAPSEFYRTQLQHTNNAAEQRAVSALMIKQALALNGEAP